MTTVRAIDAGYGNTKFVSSRVSGGEIICKQFPSLSPAAANLDISSGVIARRDTVTIEVDGTKYETGPDVGLALGTHTSRVLHKNFTNTPEYLVLNRAALFYMHQTQIDLLVVGLPVSMLASRNDTLKQKLEGLQNVANGETVHVRRTLVLAQPLGGFIHYSLTRGLYSQFRQQRNLIVDVGFFTLDWILAKGIQPIPKRCGSFAGGMHSVLRRLAQTISENFGVDFDDLVALDDGLRSGILHIFGKQVDLERYLPAMKPVVNESVNALVNIAGDGQDIDNIVIVGGGAPFFRDEISRRFPTHHVETVQDSVFANVKGFQLAGEELMHRKIAEVV